MGSLVALPLPVPAPPSPLERIKAQVLRRTPDDGLESGTTPGVCFYRFSKSSAFRKSVTFGVTLGVVLDGRKTVAIDGHELVAESSELIVITRETELDVAVTSFGSERPYLGFCVCFRPERVARALVALAEAGGRSGEETVPGFVMSCDAAIAGALERVIESLADPLDEKLITPLVMDEILFRLLRSDAASAVRAGVGSAGDANRILESMRFIRAHHTQKLKVEALARKVAMSPSHFAHRFRAVARTTPMRYLREVRLEQARALLLEQGARAGEVGMSVGFESPAHFAREFKRRYGVSPSHYLRARAG